MITDCKLLRAGLLRKPTLQATILVALALARVIAVIDHAADSSRSDFDFLLCDVNRNRFSGVVTATTQRTLFVLFCRPIILPYSNFKSHDTWWDCRGADIHIHMLAKHLSVVYPFSVDAHMRYII